MADPFSIVLAWNNLADAGTVSGGGGVSTLPVQNVQDPQPRKVYRTLSTSAYVIADLGSAQAADLLALAGTNLTTAATGARVRASNLDPTVTSSLVYDSSADGAVVSIGPDPRYLGDLFVLFGSQQTARYWRIDVSDATLSAIDIGRLWVGPKFVPSRNVSYGYGFGWGSTGVQQRSVYGQLHVKRGAQFRVARLALEMLTEAEMAASLAELQRIAGAAGDVLFVENPVATYAAARAFIGLLDPGSIGPMINHFFGLYRVDLTIGERL